MLSATEGLKISVNLNPFGFVAAKDSNCIFKQYIAKEDPTLKVSFFVMPVHKKQSEFQNTSFLLIQIQILIDFDMLT